MTGVFLYVTLASFKNAMRSRVQRLREPRYAIGLVFGVAYLVFAFGRSNFRAYHRASSETGTPLSVFLNAHHGGPEVLGGMVLVMLVGLAWAFSGSSRPALAFSRSEVQFFFPAPITHRQLIHYKILRTLGGTALTSAILTLLIHLGDLGTAWMLFAGLWMVTVTVNLHLTGVQLRRQSLAEHGRIGIRFQLLPLVIVGGAVAVVLASVALQWPAFTRLSVVGAVLDELDRLGHQFWLGAVLFFPIGLSRLPLSATPQDFVATLPITTMILLANYVWVVRSDRAFIDAAATHAERQAERRAARQATASESVAARRPVPFTLRPVGRPEVALLWKNLIMIGRYANVAFGVRMAVALGALGVLLSRRFQGPAETIAMLAIFGACLVTLLGAQWVRSDLRRDLVHLATLRTWPLSGAAIVRGEILAPTALLSAIVWLLVLIALACGAGAVAHQPLLALNRVSFGIGAMLVAPGLILTQVTIANAFVAAFPAWSRAVTSPARGIDVLGQRMLTSGGTLVATAVAVLPALAIAGTVGVGLRVLTGAVPVVVPAAIVTAVLVIENVLALEAIGRLLDQADVALLPPAA